MWWRGADTTAKQNLESYRNDSVYECRRQRNQGNRLETQKQNRLYGNMIYDRGDTINQ